MMKKNNDIGYIYVATTNAPELLDCVKIGYSQALNSRISSIRSRNKHGYLIYCCLPIPKKLPGYQYPDKFVHSIIDSLAPQLKSPKNEYYHMKPIEASQLLESIGNIYQSKVLYPLMYINKHGTLSFEIDENRIKEMLLSNVRADRPNALFSYMRSQYGPDIARAWFDDEPSNYGIECKYGDIYADNKRIAISNFPHNQEYIELIQDIMPNFWITTQTYNIVFPHILDH